eukprot:scaffold27284_cov67-Skeletonema_dohrnii-CCMP3373.AAC.2
MARFLAQLEGNSVSNSASSRSVDYHQDLSDISMDSSLHTTYRLLLEHEGLGPVILLHSIVQA